MINIILNTTTTQNTQQINQEILETSKDIENEIIYQQQESNQEIDNLTSAIAALSDSVSSALSDSLSKRTEKIQGAIRKLNKHHNLLPEQKHQFIVAGILGDEIVTQIQDPEIVKILKKHVMKTPARFLMALADTYVPMTNLHYMMSTVLKYAMDKKLLNEDFLLQWIEETIKWPKDANMDNLRRFKFICHDFLDWLYGDDDETSEDEELIVGNVVAMGQKHEKSEHEKHQEVVIAEQLQAIEMKNQVAALTRI